MATTKKPATAAADKEPKPVKASVASKAPVVAAEPAPKAAVAKKVAAKAPAKAAAVPAPVPAPAKAAEPTPAKPAAKKKVAVSKVAHDVDPEKRANYIEVAAFYIAERRGFAPGNPEQDYLEAAAEIDRLISAGHFSK
jgi:hypothetical protein